MIRFQPGSSEYLEHDNSTVTSVPLSMFVDIISQIDSLAAGDLEIEET